MTTAQCCPLCDKDVQSFTALTGHLEIGHHADPAAVLGIRRPRRLRRAVRRLARPARHLVALALMVGAVLGGAWVDDNVHGGEAQHATPRAPSR